MFGIIQIVLVIVLIAVIIVYFGKIRHAKKSLIAGLVFCIAISAVISNAVLNIIPLPTEKVIVTATGEKNEAASSNEAYIINLIVGGEEYELITPSEGKWFWIGERYMWRNENDPRQPEGTTRSITIDIPYGCGRSIQFGLSKWNGIVEITYGDDTKSYDLFKADDTEENVLYAPIPDTGFFALYGIKLLRLGLFLLIVALLMIYPSYAAMKFSDDRIKGWFEKNWDVFYYIVLAFMYIVLLQKNSVEGSMWGDELWQIGWFYGDYQQSSNFVFNFIFRIWLDIMPYGQEYLRLLSQIFVAGAILFAGLAGKEFRGKRFGILLSSSVAFSLTIADHCAKGIRSYAMVVFCTTLVLYMYFKKQKNLGSEKISHLIIYGLILALTMDTHSFSIILVGILLASDFLLIIIKKASKKCLIEFIAPVAYAIYSLSILFGAVGSSANSGRVNMLEAVKWLFSDNNVLLMFFLFGIIIVIIDCFTKIKKHSFDFKYDYVLLTITIIPIAEIVIYFLYSIFVSPGMAPWERYLITAIIMFIFVMCYGVDKSIDFVCHSLSEGKNTSKYITVLVILSLCVYNWTQITPWVTRPSNGRSRNDDYKAIAEYIMQQNDIYSSSTLFLLNHGQRAANEGFSYYLTHNGERDDINHVCMFHLPKNLEQYTTIYIAYDRYDGRWSSVIDEQYELVDNNKTVKVKKYVKK